MNDKLVTIAALLKEQGYATGQFGKNHLGDLNHMLPTNHGFDEFYGNLYHLNAEEEPEMDNYPKGFPNSGRCSGRAASSTPSQPTRTTRPSSRVGASVGKQKIEDTGPLTKKRMETCDDDFVAAANDFIKRAGRGRQALLRLAEHHAHAPVHAHQEGEPRPGRPLAVALSRHDDRP